MGEGHRVWVGRSTEVLTPVVTKDPKLLSYLLLSDWTAWFRSYLVRGGCSGASPRWALYALVVDEV